MTKNLWIRATVASMLTASVVVPAIGVDAASTHKGFKDVKGELVDPVNFLVGIGAVNGYSDGTYRPNAQLTYGQIIKMVAIALNIEVPKNIIAENHLIPKTNGFYDYVVRLQTNEIIPRTITVQTLNKPITRGEVAQILAKATKLNTVDVSNKVSPFKDTVGLNNYVLPLYELGITKGTTATTFSPHTVVKRGQIASFLYRIHQKQADITSYIGKGLIRNLLEENNQVYNGGSIGRFKATMTSQLIDELQYKGHQLYFDVYEEHESDKVAAVGNKVPSTATLIHHEENKSAPYFYEDIVVIYEVDAQGTIVEATYVDNYTVRDEPHFAIEQIDEHTLLFLADNKYIDVAPNRYVRKITLYGYNVAGKVTKIEPDISKLKWEKIDGIYSLRFTSTEPLEDNFARLQSVTGVICYSFTYSTFDEQINLTALYDNLSNSISTPIYESSLARLLDVNTLDVELYNNYETLRELLLAIPEKQRTAAHIQKVINDVKPDLKP